MSWAIFTNLGNRMFFLIFRVFSWLKYSGRNLCRNLSESWARGAAAAATAPFSFYLPRTAPGLGRLLCAGKVESLNLRLYYCVQSCVCSLAVQALHSAQKKAVFRSVASKRVERKDVSLARPNNFNSTWFLKMATYDFWSFNEGEEFFNQVNNTISSPKIR